MIDRHEGCALSAGGNVGGAEIMHHGDVDRPGQRRTVADLHRQSSLRAMQHSLAVEADDIDVLAADPVLRGERRDRFGMGDGDGPFGLAQDARPGLALVQMDGLGQSLAQQAALCIGIGPVAGRPKRLDPASVSFDQRNVDPVERGPTHQTECR